MKNQVSRPWKEEFEVLDCPAQCERLALTLCAQWTKYVK